VPPDDIPPAVTAAPNAPAAWNQYGLRVPAFVISPFAKRNYVSRVVHDHTSVLRFIETKFNLGALTRRDANADNLLDCLDFRRPGFREPPRLAAPGLPSTGSSCQPQTPPPPTAAVATSGVKTTALVRGGVDGRLPKPMTVSQQERVKLLAQVRESGLSLI
jgi:phospholipase C